MSSLSTRFLNTGQDGDIVSLSLGEMIQKQAELREHHEFNGEIVKQKQQINHREHFNMWDVKNIVEVSKQWHEVSKKSDLALLDKPAVEGTADTAEPNFTESGIEAKSPTDLPEGTEGLLEEVALDEEGNPVAATPEDTGPAMITVEEADNQAQARYAEGLNEGKQQGEEQVRNQLAEQFTTIASLMNSLQAVDTVEMGHFRADLEQSVQNIIFDLVAVKIDEFPEIIAGRITDSLNKFTEDINGIHLTLNPTDWDLLQDDNDFMAQIDGLAIRTTERIKRGGCILKSDNMEINATLEHQMQLGDDFGRTPSNQKVAEAHKMVADMVDEGPENQTENQAVQQPDESPAPQTEPESDPDTPHDTPMDMTESEPENPDIETPTADTAETAPPETPETIDFDADQDAHAGNSNHIGLDDEPVMPQGTEMALNAMTGEMEEVPEGTLDLSQGFPDPSDMPQDPSDVPQVDDDYESEMAEEDPFAIEESIGEEPAEEPVEDITEELPEDITEETAEDSTGETNEDNQEG